MSECFVDSNRVMFQILLLRGPFKPILQVRQWGREVSFPKIIMMGMSRLSHCFFQVLWYFYNVVCLLHIADEFLFGSSLYSALLQDQTPIASCCRAIENLERFHAGFFTLFHGITLTIRSFMYLLTLLHSAFRNSICSFLFLILPVGMGLLVAILGSTLSIHIVDSSKMPCER